MTISMIKHLNLKMANTHTTLNQHYLYDLLLNGRILLVDNIQHQEAIIVLELRHVCGQQIGSYFLLNILQGYHHVIIALAWSSPIYTISVVYIFSEVCPLCIYYM